MTEKLPSLLAQSLTPSQTALPSPKPVPALPSHVSSKAQAPAEEEPYTIKCICDFTDDDGNTIYCEVCDTWQHIECYYPHSMEEALREDFSHSCVDCNPRLLVDRERAQQRQAVRQNKTNSAEILERKPKSKPTSKTHKKKTKPNDLGVNGNSPSDTMPKNMNETSSAHSHKKSKSVHRPSQSISSQNPKRSPSYGQKNGNPHAHPPSPATTPPDLPHEFEIHGFSPGFLDLYRENQDVSIVPTNSFARLQISDVLSSWLRNHDKLREETGCGFKEVFRELPGDINSTKASPRVTDKSMTVGTETVRWQYLTSPQAVGKDVPLIELNGQIGIQKNYCEDPENRWHDLTSPLPFVFFHPMLPIYIDTRREGSKARYVRRSCKPNAQMDTFLLNGSEYRFWLMSDRPIVANEQITIPWDFRLPKNVAHRWLQLLGLSDESDHQPEYNERDLETYHTIAGWVHAILSEYGGCACDLGPDCAFARFHRNYISRINGREKSRPKKPRKLKPTNISPTSTGHATNSRAPSEGHGDDGMENDSGSSRSKPPSRDITPAPRQGSFDTLGVLTELTDRDKRKVQMVEDSFRRMEQQQPPRKKKRISDGASSSSTVKSKSKTNGASERRYVDAGTRTSKSPTSAVSPGNVGPPKQYGNRGSVPIPSRHSSQGPRPEYTDASTQTDPVEGEWFSASRQSPKPKKRVVSLSKRLLENRHRLRADEEQRRRTVAASPGSVASALVRMELDSPTTPQSPTTLATAATPKPSKDDSGVSIAAKEEAADIPMSDAPVLSPTDDKVSSIDTSSAARKVGTKSPELRVQLPPVPAFSSPSVTSSATTPVLATGNLIQSPFANNLPSPFAPPSANGAAVQPSPVKKKLSLSDYTKSRMNKAAAAAKPSPNSLKPPTAISEEARSPVSMTDTVMLDSPLVDKHNDI
ncbi:hypothetical protein F5Y15DRAFT_415889 [Xylariaceae sp. FL0016]|nr:hypothetical protein F5Y15DRAFT_415889 [Xylariaceae sp. FL0016]